MKVPTPPAPKKVYHAPKLTVYGTVRNLTGTGGSTHIHGDGGPGLRNKTA